MQSGFQVHWNAIVRYRLMKWLVTRSRGKKHGSINLTNISEQVYYQLFMYIYRFWKWIHAKITTECMVSGWYYSFQHTQAPIDFFKFSVYIITYDALCVTLGCSVVWRHLVSTREKIMYKNLVRHSKRAYCCTTVVIYLVLSASQRLLSMHNLYIE